MRLLLSLVVTLATQQSVEAFATPSPYRVRAVQPHRRAETPVAGLGAESARKVALIAGRSAPPVAESSAVAAVVTTFLQSTPGKIVVLVGIGYWWKRRSDRKATEEAEAKAKEVDILGAVGDLGGVLVGAASSLVETPSAEEEAEEEEEGVEYEEVEEVTYEYVDEEGNVVEVDEADESVEILAEDEPEELTGNAAYFAKKKSATMAARATAAAVAASKAKEKAAAANKAFFEKKAARRAAVEAKKKAVAEERKQRVEKAARVARKQAQAAGRSGGRGTSASRFLPGVGKQRGAKKKSSYLY
jgi:hypothetical protein